MKPKQDRNHGPQEALPVQRPGERLIMGRNCIIEVLRLQPRRAREIWIGSAENSGVLQEISAHAEKLNIPLNRVRGETLNAFVRSESHQGVVAAVSERSFEDLDSLIERLAGKERATVMLLDSIMDPHNLGAILRVAECFGVDAVIWSKNRGVDLTPVVSKSSVGASEIVPIVRVSNLVAAAEKLKDAGFWLVGSALAAEARSLWSYEVPQKMALAIGSEENGLQQLLKKKCDELLVIPMGGKIESLNVAQATAVMLAETNRQRATVNEKNAH